MMSELPKTCPECGNWIERDGREVGAALRERIRTLSSEGKGKDDRIKELEDFVQAEGAAHYSHREFEKMEAERDSWREVAAAITTDVRMLYEAAKDFHDNWCSEAFGDITHEELGKVLDALDSVEQEQR